MRDPAAGRTNMKDRILTARDRTFAEILSLLYITLIAIFALRPGFSYLLFPELAALSHDILTRPWGKWASQPWRLIATPTLTAIIGVARITRCLPYHVLTVLLIVCLSILVIFVLKSNIAPAISAGVLPLVLGTKSWLYPISIMLGLIALALASVLWRKLCIAKYDYRGISPNGDVDDVLESTPSGSQWFGPWLAFVAVVGVCARSLAFDLFYFLL